jgi:hypothetical protein
VESDLQNICDQGVWYHCVKEDVGRVNESNINTSVDRTMAEIECDWSPVDVVACDAPAGSLSRGNPTIPRLAKSKSLTHAWAAFNIHSRQEVVYEN